jgi:hypothetical protein
MNNHLAVKPPLVSTNDILSNFLRVLLIGLFIFVGYPTMHWLAYNLPKPNPQQMRQDVNQIIFDFESNVKLDSDSTQKEATIIEPIDTKGFDTHHDRR